MSEGWGRRVVLGGGVAVGAAAVLRGAQAGAASERSRRIDFHGRHQAGITTPRQAAATFVACDVTAGSRAQLKALLHALTDRARLLTSGYTPADPGIAGPPEDSGVLGSIVVPDGLTVTVALGASLFDDRFGLADQKPRQLRPMDTFPDDRLDPAQCHGDLLLQVCADHPDTVQHALRDLLKHTRGLLQPRWRVDGYVSPPRPDGAPRNAFGFKDGTANPDADEAARLVWIRDGEPDWAVGGTYLVVRTIRMLVEFWDRVGITEQEKLIGRTRDSGAPLSGSRESDVPDFAGDPTGSVTPLDAHIRLANPRAENPKAHVMLRRGYTYDRGLDVNGNLDTGLVFVAAQADLDAGFVAAQKRLVGEPLTDYISPIGGGYFLALPGVRDAEDWWGSTLLD